MTEANLTDIALDPANILQIGFVNPAQYYFEFYLNTEWVPYAESHSAIEELSRANCVSRYTTREMGRIRFSSSDS